MGLISRVSSRTYRIGNMPTLNKSREFLSSTDSSSDDSDSSGDSIEKVTKLATSQESLVKTQEKLAISEKSQKSEKKGKIKKALLSSSSEEEQEEEEVSKNADLNSSSSEEEVEPEKPPTPEIKKEKKKSDKENSEPRKSKNKVPSDKTKYQVQMGTTGKKYIRCNVFRGTTYADLRELYEKDGELLPGKKGISMRADMIKKLYSLEKKT